MSCVTHGNLFLPLTVLLGINWLIPSSIWPLSSVHNDSTVYLPGSERTLSE